MARLGPAGGDREAVSQLLGVRKSFSCPTVLPSFGNILYRIRAGGASPGWLPVPTVTLRVGGGPGGGAEERGQGRDARRSQERRLPGVLLVLFALPPASDGPPRQGHHPHGGCVTSCGHSADTTGQTQTSPGPHAGAVVAVEEPFPSHEPRPPALRPAALGRPPHSCPWKVTGHVSPQVPAPLRHLCTVLRPQGLRRGEALRSG